MLLPPGGFLVLGFLLAGKRLLDNYLHQQKARRYTPLDSQRVPIA
jgi:electron transport complex protein RnfE